LQFVPILIGAAVKVALESLVPAHLQFTSIAEIGIVKLQDHTTPCRFMNRIIRRMMYAFGSILNDVPDNLLRLQPLNKLTHPLANKVVAHDRSFKPKARSGEM
jgi:hypothetical protein